jgi:P-type conjugative transfer protein TrbJ
MTSPIRSHRLLLLGAVAALGLYPALLAPPAAAQFAVIDVANLAQNILTAARTLEEVNNQITQIQQFVSMLDYDARNVASLPSSVLPQLDASVSQITQLMGQAQGILYDIQNVDQQFARYYPNAIDPASPDAQLIADAHTRWDYSVASFRHTMEVQSRIVQDLGEDQARMDDLVGESQGATGILQATQAGNQLLALQSKQLAATQALLASQARAQALEEARKAAAEEQAREQYRRFLGDAPANYVPVPVTMFHD